MDASHAQKRPGRGSGEAVPGLAGPDPPPAAPGPQGPFGPYGDAQARVTARSSGAEAPLPPDEGGGGSGDDGAALPPRGLTDRLRAWLAGHELLGLAPPWATWPDYERVRRWPGHPGGAPCPNLARLCLATPRRPRASRSSGASPHHRPLIDRRLRCCQVENLNALLAGLWPHASAAAEALAAEAAPALLRGVAAASGLGAMLAGLELERLELGVVPPRCVVAGVNTGGAAAAGGWGLKH
jgi:hypothetical protein